MARQWSAGHLACEQIDRLPREAAIRTNVHERIGEVEDDLDTPVRHDRLGDIELAFRAARKPHGFHRVRERRRRA